MVCSKDVHVMVTKINGDAMSVYVKPNFLSFFMLLSILNNSRIVPTNHDSIYKNGLECCWNV